MGTTLNLGKGNAVNMGVGYEARTPQASVAFESPEMNNNYVEALPGLVDQVRKSGRLAIVHLDLVTGLSQKSIAVDFVRQAGADGVITTRALLARRARELGLITVLRIFAIDSMAIQNLRREQLQVQPDLIELMPGIIPKVIARVGAETDVPIIAGGLITDKSDVLAALSAGAVGISTSREELWRA